MVRLADHSGLKLCGNGVAHHVCNWLLPADSAEELCQSCRMNRIVPDLNDQRNKLLWRRTEMAKRRLIYTLLGHGITLPSREEQSHGGLAFDIISTILDPSVTTGHLDGVITVNLEEADDTYRQINRQQLGESSRTLLGHFRHESAHYFWGRFLSNLEWGDPQRVAFRERFGDEWIDYADALNGYYQRGAPTDWQEHYVSAYASSHPWEDWAETWAHYLQIIDGLETCEALGIQAQALAVPMTLLSGAAGTLPEILPQTGYDDGSFLAMLQRWMCVSTVLNEVSNSLGEAPLYPFFISETVAQKLRLAHYFAEAWGGRSHECTTVTKG